MKRNEPDATKRRTRALAVFDVNGDLAPGITFSHAAHEVKISLDGAPLVDAAADLYEIGGGYYGYPPSQAETDVNVGIFVLPIKAGYRCEGVNELIEQPGSDLATVLALLHHNAMVDGGAGVPNPTYSANGVLTSGRLRRFSSAAALAAATAGAADGADAEVFLAHITSADIGTGLMAWFKLAVS